jgi:hypothetical protein
VIMKRKRAIKQIYTTHKRLCNNLHYVHSKDCKSNNWNPRVSYYHAPITESAELGDDFCWSLFVILQLVFCPFFDWWILNTSLVSSNNWNPRDQENQVRVVKPVAQRGDPYALYVGIVWRYQRGVQNPSIEKRTEN